MKPEFRTQVAIFAIFLTLTVGGCFLLGSSPAELTAIQDRLDNMERARRTLENEERRITANAGTARAAGNTAEAERLEKIAADYKAEVEKLTAAAASTKAELDDKKNTTEQSDGVAETVAAILGVAGFGTVGKILLTGRKMIATLKYQYEQRQLFDIATVDAIEEFRKEVPAEIGDKLKNKLMKSHQMRGIADLAKKIVNGME